MDRFNIQSASSQPGSEAARMPLRIYAIKTESLRILR